MLLERGKSENRIRKLNVLYLEKESGNGHSFLLICFFLFVGFFVIFVLIFSNLCLGFVMISLLSRTTIFVKYNYLFSSLWLGSPTAG